MAKKKKRAKNSKNKKDNQKRALEFKDDMQEYAIMSKMLGDRRIMVTLPDKSEKLAIIPGRFRKRCWMKVGDVLLVSYRDFQTKKLDVCHKYDADEARLLESYNEIPPFFLDNSSGGGDEEEDDGIVFEIDDVDEDGKKVELNFDDI